MANFLQTLIPLLFSIALLFALALSPARGQGDTSSFTYDFYGSKPTDITYEGDAHFPSDTTYLRLTQTRLGSPITSSAGRALHSKTVRFSDGGAKADFETTLKFIIKADPNDNDPADGLAFFVAPAGYKFPSSTNGGGLGVFGSSGSSANVFAVEFDIYANGWDPRYRHVGIDIESWISVNETKVGDGLIGQEVTARINYVAATDVISVYVDAGSKRYEVRYVYDLSKILPDKVQVGLGASTGAHVAFHDVVSWYFSSTIVKRGSYGRRGDFIRQFV